MPAAIEVEKKTRVSGAAEGGRLRLFSVIGLVAAVSIAHYTTPPHQHYYHEIYQVLYYIPIILAGFWFGVKGGAITAIVITSLFIPHVLFQWGGSLHGPNLYKALTILLYNVIGWVAGFLSEKERRARRMLEASYDRLKMQTEALIEAEEQLRRADRLSALGELSAGLAHEIRNPLGSILGTAEILAEKIPPGKEGHEFSRILLKEVSRLNEVVTRFLDFARPQAPTVAACDVNETLDSVLALTASQRNRARIQLVDRRGRSLPPVSFDPDQLRQVFLNLVLNAVQAMPEGGRITVESAAENGFVRCTISDSGSGVPDENRDRIFNPFFTTKDRGTGLGLSIVHKILANHRATITVESESGRGATFALRFPIEHGGAA